MPVGVAPAGPGTEESGVRLPPLTANPLTASAPASTTHSVEPSGESRASSAPAPSAPGGVLRRNVSPPPAEIA